VYELELGASRNMRFKNAFFQKDWGLFKYA
jgi:hypothetical protein